MPDPARESAPAPDPQPHQATAGPVPQPDSPAAAPASQPDHTAATPAPSRRRALRPAVVAAAAVVAVGVASATGALASGHLAPRRTAGVGVAPVAGATPAPDARVGISAADRGAARGAAQTSPPTGTGAVGGPVSPGDASARPADTTGDTGAEAAVLTLVNQARATAGCPALTADPKLTAAARAHSADMARRGYFAHDSPEGVTVGSRITTAGYRFSAAGENIAKGQQSAAAVMRAWLNSPGHRANILNCRFRNIGVGLARQGPTPLWTQDFGTPLS